VRARICGPEGIAWDRAATVRIPTPAPDEDGPLAIPVIAEEVALKGPAGEYELAMSIERGAAGTEASWQFHLTDPGLLPRLKHALTLWGVPADAENWLRRTAQHAENLPERRPERREIILVGDVSKTGKPEDWRELARRMAAGSAVVFLFAPGLPAGEGRCGLAAARKKGSLL